MKCIVCETEYGDSGLCPRCGYDRSVDFIAVRSLSVPDAASRYVRSNNLRFADNIMNSKRNDEPEPQPEPQQELPEQEENPEASKDKKKKKRLWLLALIPLLLLGAYSIVYAVRGGWVRTEYDDAGNVIKETWYNYFGVIDGDGNRTKETGYRADGSVTYEHEYDSAGNMTKDTYYHADGSVSYEHEYDGAGNLTKEKQYREDGSLDRWYEYEYDIAGNRTKGTIYDADGSVSYSW